MAQPPIKAPQPLTYTPPVASAPFITSAGHVILGSGTERPLRLASSGGSQPQVTIQLPHFTRESLLVDSDDEAEWANQLVNYLYSHLLVMAEPNPAGSTSFG